MRERDKKLILDAYEKFRYAFLVFPTSLSSLPSPLCSKYRKSQQQKINHLMQTIREESGALVIRT
jgi:hypothetical protein